MGPTGASACAPTTIRSADASGEGSAPVGAVPYAVGVARMTYCIACVQLYRAEHRARLGKRIGPFPWTGSISVMQTRDPTRFRASGSTFQKYHFSSGPAGEAVTHFWKSHSGRQERIGYRGTHPA
jgi:hypothetical protein